MHPELTTHMAAQRIAELLRQADHERMLLELRAGRGQRPRRWSGIRPALRGSRPAAA